MGNTSAVRLSARVSADLDRSVRARARTEDRTLNTRPEATDAEAREQAELMLNQPTDLIKKVPEPDYPWDRQADESPQAFEAFAIYRDMAYQRSLAAAGWKLHKSKKLLERWSAAHGWVKRVAAWAQH